MIKDTIKMVDTVKIQKTTKQNKNISKLLN